MRLKVFLISLFLSMFFWSGMNAVAGKLDNFLFLQKLAKNPQIFTPLEKYSLRGFTAEVGQAMLEEELGAKKENSEPIRNSNIADMEINAKSAISIWVGNSGDEKILFKKDSDKKLPIASLAKLMTAYVVLENYELLQVVKIPKEAVGHDEDFGKFKIGESFTTENLLYPLLIESSNDAAIALAQVIGEDGFVDLMNLETKNILGSDYQDTLFVNPTGLDPKKPDGPINYSTTEDLVKLSIYLLKEQPLIWQILNYPEFDLYSYNGVFHHKILNTNELLGKIPGIIGGKTGETRQAGGCLILILESPNNNGFLINIILGSEDRFLEMQRLVDWLKEAYKW